MFIIWQKSAFESFQVVYNMELCPISHCTPSVKVKGLLTKSGYITKINRNNGKLYTNNSYIIPNPSKLKKLNFNLDILVQSLGLILSNSNWNYDVSSQANESPRNWPITEWIHCDELLFTTTCQSSSTGWPTFISLTMTNCDWPVKS